MHVKRSEIEKTWPIPRKGTKYVIRASHNKKHGLPVLIILRDLLKVAKNRKEIKRILQEKKVLLNGKIVRKEQLSVMPFDIIKIGNKNYELSFSNKGKFILIETGRKELILKVTGKKILKNKKLQLNLLYGKNILTSDSDKEKVNIGDSVVIDKGKIIKILQVKVGREVIIFDGKYKGREGKIEKIEKNVAIISYEKEKLNVPIKNIFVAK